MYNPIIDRNILNLNPGTSFYSKDVIPNWNPNNRSMVATSTLEFKLDVENNVYPNVYYSHTDSIGRVYVKRQVD